MERKTDGRRLGGAAGAAGFTLMELLFVLLLIALVVSFALPAFRSVRFDAQNARAKTALQKLAQARRSFYQDTRGWNITPANFNATGVAGLSGSCDSTPFSGIPGTGGTRTKDYAQLFLCGYLNKKDFANLNYTFYICGAGSVASCTGVSAVSASAYAAAVGNNEASAGKKYLGANGYVMYVDYDMKVSDTDE